MKEEWKTIEGYENYQVSNLGNVKSLDYNRTGKEKILKPAKNKNGYSMIQLFQNGKGKGFLLHRLVAQAFLPNPNNYPQVNHKDEDKTNNLFSNLEWCTPSYNNNYGTKNERHSKALKGRKHSQEWNENIAKSKKGKKQSKETIEKRTKVRSIAVVQLDLQRNFISVHQSSKQIERDFGFAHNNIIKCCKGKRKTAYKFKWKYLSEYKKAV